MLLNFLDIIWFVCASLSVLFGAYTGAVKLSIGFIFFLLSIVFSYFIFDPIGQILSEYISNQFAINIISLCLSYLISALFCAFIAKQLKKLSEDIAGGFVDRVFGTFLGVVRGVTADLIIFLIVIIFTGKSYHSAENMLELVTKQKDETYPSWVKNASGYKQMSYVLENTIEFIGKEHLKTLKLPKFLPHHNVELKRVESHKDAFDVMKSHVNGE